MSARLTNGQVFLLMAANTKLLKAITREGLDELREAGGIDAMVAFPTVTAALGLVKRGLFTAHASGAVYKITEAGQVALQAAQAQVDDLVERSRDRAVKTAARHAAEDAAWEAAEAEARAAKAKAKDA